MHVHPHADLARALAAPSARGSLAIVERTLRRGETTPLHVHRTPEAFHVLEGELAVFVGDEEVTLTAGESLVAPAGIAHALRAPSGAARYLSGSLVRSAALYEDFLRAVSLPFEPDGDWAESDDAFRLATLAAPNGIEVLGAPGALPRTSAVAYA